MWIMTDLSRPDPLAPPDGYGQAPATRGQAQRDNDGTDVTLCTMIAAGGTHCMHQVTEIWSMGCVRAEHAGRFGICACHAMLGRAVRHTCTPCRVAGFGETEMKIISVDELPFAGPSCGEGMGIGAALDALGIGAGSRGSRVEHDAAGGRHQAGAPGRDRPDGPADRLP